LQRQTDRGGALCDNDHALQSSNTRPAPLRQSARLFASSRPWLSHRSL